MKIFISYSTNDGNLVYQIANQIKPHAEVYYWDQNKTLGDGAWITIFNWIDSSDLVFAVITGNTVSRGMAVGQEIGRAIARGKTVIPLVTQEVPFSELGFLNGVTYQPINYYNLAPALQAVEGVILQRKKKEEDAKQAMFLIGGAVVLMLLASQS
jgi:hypothetical protein